MSSEDALASAMARRQDGVEGKDEEGTQGRSGYKIETVRSTLHLV